MTAQVLPDTEHRGLIGLLPAWARPYALLARFDRPIGWWLLFWPGAWAIALSGQAIARWDLFLWFLLGSVVMRGAGCVYNDIVDRDLDRRVERTRDRPLASGAVSLKAAWIWLFLLCLIGLVVLVQLRLPAVVAAVASLALVAAYPFMKRITWWPQAWLGMVFSWAAVVAWAQAPDAPLLPGVLLYLGCIPWVIGYDTIYALQDREDDALVGVRSSARRMGNAVRPGVGGFYALALLLWAAAFWTIRPDVLALVALLPAAVHLAWQVLTLKVGDNDSALARFRSNRTLGMLMAAACFVLGTTSL